MSNARPVGCARRQPAILVHGGNRRSWVAGIGADALRDTVRDYVIEHLADNDAVLVIDETGFLRQGKASCGVARQYTGSAEDYGLSDRSLRYPRSWFIDRALYLPKEWTEDPDRLEAVPPDAGFATKPKFATRMIARATATFVPFKWVAGDTVYGVVDIEQQLRRAGKGYVLGSAALMYSIPGASGDPSLARPPTSPRRGVRPTGSACRPGSEPKDRGCMIGAMSNWPISKSKN